MDGDKVLWSPNKSKRKNPNLMSSNSSFVRDDKHSKISRIEKDKDNNLTV